MEGDGGHGGPRGTFLRAGEAGEQKRRGPTILSLLTLWKVSSWAPGTSGSPLLGPGVRNNSPCKVAPSWGPGLRRDCVPSRRPIKKHWPLILQFPQGPGKSWILPEAFKAKQAVFSTPSLSPLPSQHQGSKMPSQPACLPWVSSDPLQRVGCKECWV